MREDVAVVQPATGVVLDEAGRDGFVRAHRRVVSERPRWIFPAVAVDVERVEVGVHPERVDLDVLADARLQRRRVAGIGAPVDAVQVGLQAGDRRRQLVGEQRVEAIGLLRALRAHDDRAEQAPERVERVVRPVVVIRPGADRLGRALPLVGERLAGRDEAARARVLAHVGAVVLRVVLDAVRVHGDRLAELPVGVAEVHDHHVADLGGQRRAGDVGMGRRVAREAGGHQAVDVRRVGVAAGEGAVVPVVAAGRRDRPAHGLGLHPVLAPDPARGRLDLRHRLGARRPWPADARGGGVGLLEPTRGRDVDLAAADRAEERRAAGEAEEGATSRREWGHAAGDPSTFVLGLQVRSYRLA